MENDALASNGSGDSATMEPTTAAGLKPHRPEEAAGLWPSLLRVYMVGGMFLSLFAATGIFLTAASDLTWQFAITGAFGTYIGQPGRYIWLALFTAPSLFFALLLFAVMLRASTRLQQQATHGIIAAPLSFFTSNNPGRVLRTLTKDSQVSA